MLPASAGNIVHVHSAGLAPNAAANCSDCEGPSGFALIGGVTAIADGVAGNRKTSALPEAAGFDEAAVTVTAVGAVTAGGV